MNTTEPTSPQFNVYTFTAPEYWASYLINGDFSGLSDDEKAACDRWTAHLLETIGTGAPVDCEDAGFCRTHDAWSESPFSGDCQTYTFLAPVVSRALA